MSADSVTTQAADADQIAFALAHNRVGERSPITEVLGRHNITLVDFLRVKDSPIFRRKLTEYVEELKTNGTSFRLKARIQAEELLKTNWRIIHDPTTPAQVAVKAIENTVRWADLEPAKKLDDSYAARPAITVNIDLGEGRSERVVIEQSQENAARLQSAENGS